MKNLATSTALAIVLAFGGGASLATSALAQEAAADFGLIDADENDVLSEAEYSAWNGGVFDDDDGLLSDDEFADEEEFAEWDADDDGDVDDQEFLIDNFLF